MPDTRRQSETTEFQAWQVRALNVLLIVLALAATPVVIFVGAEAIRASGAVELPRRYSVSCTSFCSFWPFSVGFRTGYG